MSDFASALDQYVALYEQSPNLTPEEFKELIECEKRISEWLVTRLNELTGKELAIRADIEYFSDLLNRLKNSAGHWRKAVEESLKGVS